MRPVGEIDVVPLFPPLHEKLVELLRSLDAEDWTRPTAAALWTVKDVAAHLLDGDVRGVSRHRDGFVAPPPSVPIDTYAELVAYLNAINAEWVQAMWRASPRVITEWIAELGAQVARSYADMDPHAPSPHPVSWAGEEVSRNWFHIAREYTERWHHQQQIRDAVGRPGIETRELYHPVLDAFMRALPHAYRGVDAEDGAAVTVTVTGEAGGDWTIVREGAAWRLYHGRPERAAARVTLDPDLAWRLFTTSRRTGDYGDRVRIDGPEALGRPALAMVSVMA